MVKDVVCGMDVDERRAVAKSEYQGQTYYFCVPLCKKAFDKDPARYVPSGATNVPELSAVVPSTHQS